MFIYQAFTDLAYTYLALHGTYGILWVVKSNIFPDKRFDEVLPPLKLIGYVIMGPIYWISPYIITAQNISISGLYLAFCITMYLLGMFLHFVSDMQKHTFLQFRGSENSNKLLRNGLWKRLRNPNYLGEFLIYFSLAIISTSWIPVIVLLLIVIFAWIPFMNQKDRSLSRYPEFEDWKANSWKFIPYVY